MHPKVLFPLVASVAAMLSLTGCYEETYYGRPYHTAYYGGDPYYRRPYYTDVNVVYRDGYYRDRDDRYYYGGYERARDDRGYQRARDDRRYREDYHRQEAYRKPDSRIQAVTRTSSRQEVIVKKKKHDRDHDRD